jgi:hypothetical protein
MPIDYKEIDEGALISASGTESSLEKIRTELNDLDEESIEKHTLHDAHLPSTVVATGSNEQSGDSCEQFAASGVNVFGYALSAGLAGYPFHDYPGWNTVSGWATVINSSLSENVDLEQSKTLGVLILANVNIKHIQAEYSVGTRSVHPSHMAALAIQVQVDDGYGVTSWVHIPRTERYVDLDTTDDNDFTDYVPKHLGSYDVDLTGKDVAIRTFVKQSDINPNRYITAVRLVASALANHGDTNVTWRQANISAIGLQAQEISVHG